MADFFENLVYSEEDLISFPGGIPGFESIKKYVVVKLPDYEPFEWLVAADGTKLRFAMINPMLCKPDYNPDIKKSHLDDLGIEKKEDVLLYTLVTIKENPAESTINLVGPIIINKSKKLGRQIILEDDKYSTRTPIMGES